MKTNQKDKTKIRNKKTFYEFGCVACGGLTSKKITKKVKSSK